MVGEAGGSARYSERRFLSEDAVSQNKIFRDNFLSEIKIGYISCPLYGVTQA